MLTDNNAIYKIAIMIFTIISLYIVLRKKWYEGSKAKFETIAIKQQIGKKPIKKSIIIAFTKLFKSDILLYSLMFFTIAGNLGFLMYDYLTAPPEDKKQ